MSMRLMLTTGADSDNSCQGMVGHRRRRGPLFFALVAAAGSIGGFTTRTRPVGPIRHGGGMPTSAHETPLELLRLDQSLPDWVQNELLGDGDVGTEREDLLP
ncbi:hypothetical protein [Pseudofrankia sp. BMG5.37]|uniref:hypothetical protein n=1 Tax=Pseudofrankia sp. BMG5.37 TaxID=3050035 RepID=UPI0028953B68|nr:hypothetical protein [Pseudofrankia sp. BMG5.37]MDT3440961.1 hypothetical protein [Pseudofrankia sp. BMG5.37]